MASFVVSMEDEGDVSRKKPVTLIDSDLRPERANWLKTQLEGCEKGKAWKVKCKDVQILLCNRFPDITNHEAGKIVKEAFPFVKRQTCHQRNKKAEYYYYRIQKIKTDEEQYHNYPEAHKSISLLEDKLIIKEKELTAKSEELHNMRRDYLKSVKKVKTLEKQKKTLGILVTELEDSQLRGKVLRREEASKAQHSEEYLLAESIEQIPEHHLKAIKDHMTIIGSGSYGSCELKLWRNIKVCVKKVHQKASIEEVEREAVILKKLQQSLFVPVLLGMNTAMRPFYIVTKFHSVTFGSSLTLYKAIVGNVSISQRKWIRILHRCALGLKSIHELGFIHNDLHLKNIILDRINGHIHPIIIDFGKACKIGEGRCRKVNDIEEHKQLHPWVGPETITGQFKESESSDIYGLGYIMLKVNSMAKLDSVEDLIVLCRDNKAKRPDLNFLIGKLSTIESELSKG